jgi:hypothetical protein
MCSLWIVNYKHIFFLYYWPFLYLFWISSPLNDIKYQLCYLKFYLFIVTSCFFIITCSFSVFVENCILLPMRYAWICCVPVYCTCMVLCIVHVWFCVLYMYGSVYCTCMVLIVYPFTQIFIISHKGTVVSGTKM